MRPTRRKTPRVLAFGIALLVLSLCFLTEAANLVFASPVARNDYTPAPDNTAVTMYKQDLEHTGNQTNETLLNTGNVNSSNFGKRVSYPVDGQVYTQPLFVPNVSINGALHNVVFVTTENDSVYAFDADQTSAVAALWHTSFVNPPTIVAPSNNDVQCGDMIPLDGLSGTPVIDPATGTLYVVALTKNTSNSTYAYNLHALDITTGQDKPGSPVVISGSVSGTGVDSSGGKVTFNAIRERQRAALLFSQGQVYIGFGSFCDNNSYHGWIFSYSYDGSALTRTHIYNSTPNGTRGGTWGAGGAVVADDQGNIYYVSGNGDFNGTNDYGDSFVKLTASLQVQDYFSPFNQDCLDAEDADLGSGGPLLLPAQNRMIGAGKEGRIYVVNTTNMGKYTNPYSNPDLCQNEQGKTNVDKIVQELPQHTIGGLYSSGAYWQTSSGQQFIYYAGANDKLKAFSYNGSVLSPTPIGQSPESFSFTGGNPTISSNNGAAGTGIVWTLAPTLVTKNGVQTQVGVLRAYDALNVGSELYNSQMNASRDGLLSYIKFSAATVANGEVFVGTQKSVDIFGLISNGSTGTPTGSPTPTAPPNTMGYNNIGVTFDDNTAVGNYDGANSYSSSALNADGILPGGALTGNGFLFTWPNVPAGSADNWVADGETIPITPVANADHLGFLGSATNGPSSGTAIINYSDGSTQKFTLAFNDWAAQATKTVLSGATIVAQMPYRNVKKGQQNIAMNLYIASVALQAGKAVQSVTLPTVVSAGLLHVFAIATSSLSSPIYNSVCVQTDGKPNEGATSDNGNLSPPNCDAGSSGIGSGYSANALQAAGYVPGAMITTDNFSFLWPDVPANESDNFRASGQVLAVDPITGADTLGFLGLATNGASSGTATLTYTDGTVTTFTLGFTDWAVGKLSFGNVVATKMTYRNHADGSRQNITMYLFVATVPLDSSKTLASVTLPTTITGGQMHVFSLSTRSATASVYNNAGITDDGNTGPGNFDGGGRSYSVQALQGVGVNAGDNAFDPTRTVQFTWPLSAPGTADNYLCTGEIIPIENPQTNATILAFLGASANGASSGVITVNYTDGSSQTFTIGFDDWTLGGGKIQKLSYPNEAISYRVGYRNRPGGRENVSTYVFYNYVTIDPTKTVASVVLPATTTGGQMHIFAITTSVGS